MFRQSPKVHIVHTFMEDSGQGQYKGGFTFCIHCHDNTHLSYSKNRQSLLVCNRL